jgi:hypothetical protein
MAAVRNLLLVQGEDFHEVFSIRLDNQAINLTGYIFEGDCRAEQSQSSPVLFSFTFAVINNGYAVSVDVPWEDFADVPLGSTLDNRQSQFWYDFFQTQPNGTRTKLQKGRLSIDPAITEVPAT